MHDFLGLEEFFETQDRVLIVSPKEVSMDVKTLELGTPLVRCGEEQIFTLAIIELRHHALDDRKYLIPCSQYAK